MNSSHTPANNSTLPPGGEEYFSSQSSEPQEIVPEIHGPQGAEPTRFGDWERKGRCIDF